MGKLFAEIINKYGTEYLLRQLAEECNELGQAALKLIRSWHKETPMRSDEAIEHLIEEMADVQICMKGVEGELLNGYQRDSIEEIQGRKMERMRNRLLEGKMDEDRW